MELKVPGDFFFSLLMLCYCVLHELTCFMHWNGCIQAMCYRVVCCNCIVFCNSVSAGRSGMAASKFLAAAAAGVILMCFAAENRKSHCNGGVRVANGALAADFFHFGNDDFYF